MNKTVLITGGAGYIGSITAKELLDRNFKVVIVDTLEKGHKEAVDKRAILEVANVGDKNRIAEIFRKYLPEAVIDFAAYIAVGESMQEPKKYLANNVFNFISFLDAMVENKIPCLIKSSTAAVYGIPQNEDDLPLTEDYVERLKPNKSFLAQGIWGGQTIEGEDFLQALIREYNQYIIDRPELSLSDDEIFQLRIPTSVYGLTKLLDEILMKKYDKLFGLTVLALRYFNVAGADPSGRLGQDNANPTHIFANAIFQALGKREILSVFGHDYPTPDGTGIRDYIHVNDLASGHIGAVNYLLNGGRSDTFNLGTGQGFSVIEVINAVQEASKKEIRFDFAPRRPGDVPILCANPKKANTILKWRAKYSLNDMARDAWHWHAGHPNGYSTK